MDQLDTTSLEQLSPEMADMLPDEIRQVLELQREKKLQQIESIGQAIAGKRDDAVKARAGSGIEEIWREDEEAYQGIDDANRNEQKAYKPAAPSGSFSTVKRDPSRSTVFLNITRPYVDAASARVADMLMPTDDRNWAIKPTPIPELEARLKASLQPKPQMPVEMAGMQGAPAGQMPQMPAMPAGAGQVPPQQIDPQIAQVQMILDAAKERAEKAEKRIEDWLVQCQWHAEMRKVMEDCSRLGTGILKGPTPVKRKGFVVRDNALQMTMTIEPESRRIDPWNFYPDGSCGENIHNGSYVFENDSISTRQLRDLKGLPGYITDQIDKVIDEGPGKKNIENGKKFGEKSVDDDEKFDIWYYYGVLDRDDLELLGVEVEDTSLVGVPAIVTLVNDRVIKAALNPLDSGEFPYDVIPWQRRTGSWAGTGVSRQIRTPQRMINAATRNMMDNAGISGGPIMILRRGHIEPADGQWNLTPRKFFYVKEEADVRSVADAITSIIIPSNQQEMTNIIQFALKMAEDVTGLPQLLQGSMGSQTPDTVGGMQMVQNNAGTVLRRIARTFDDCITEPHITRYYSWLMMYGEDDEKGDYIIDARGSSALVERDLQNQAIMGLVQLAVPGNPYGLDPKRTIKEALRAQKLDPNRFQLTDEEQAQQAQAMQPPPMPQVEVAKIRADVEMKTTQMEIQSDEKIAQMEAQVDQMRIQRDTDRDTVYTNSEAQRNASEHDARLRELDMKLQLAQLDYASKHEMKLEDVKAKLADTAMKLRVQKELAGASLGSDLHKHHNPSPQVVKPAVEPAGRASPGNAFTQ
jgi:hypothetical protein